MRSPLPPPHPVATDRPVRCTRCTWPIPAGTRHWILGGDPVCRTCLWPGEVPDGR